MGKRKGTKRREKKRERTEKEKRREELWHIVLNLRSL